MDLFKARCILRKEEQNRPKRSQGRNCYSSKPNQSRGSRIIRRKHMQQVRSFMEVLAFSRLQ